jgi:hypothetical protein
MIDEYLPERWRTWLVRLRERLGLRPWRARPGGTGSLLIPPAQETRASVARFRESAERYFLVDFVRDRFLNRSARLH